MFKNYTQSNLLQKQLNMSVIKSLPRNSNIKEYFMALLYKDVDLIFNLEEPFYTGFITTCVKTKNNKYLLYSDFRGTCSVCEWLDDCDDSTLIRMCLSLANDTLIFDSLNDLKEFITYVKLNCHDNDCYDNTYKWVGNVNEIFEILGDIEIDFDYNVKFKQEDISILDEFQLYWYKSTSDKYSHLFYVYKREKIVAKFYKSFYSTNILSFNKFERQSEIIVLISKMMSSFTTKHIMNIKNLNSGIKGNKKININGLLNNFDILNQNIITL